MEKSESIENYTTKYGKVYCIKTVLSKCGYEDLTHFYTVEASSKDKSNRGLAVTVKIADVILASWDKQLSENEKVNRIHQIAILRAKILLEEVKTGKEELI